MSDTVTKPTRDELIAERGELEKKLLDFRPAAYSSEQARIRSQYRNDQQRSLRVWLARRAEMEELRSQIVRRLIDIQEQLRAMKALKPRPASLPPLPERETVDAKLVFLKLNEIIADIRKMKEWMGLDLDNEAEAAG